MKVKDDFHHLIDSIDNEQVLKSYYQLVQQLNTGQSGQLWDKLNEDEKEELLIAYDESFDNKNLIPHQNVKSQHKKWLRP